MKIVLTSSAGYVKMSYINEVAAKERLCIRGKPVSSLPVDLCAESINSCSWGCLDVCQWDYTYVESISVFKMMYGCSLVANGRVTCVRSLVGRQ